MSKAKLVRVDQPVSSRKKAVFCWALLAATSSLGVAAVEIAAGNVAPVTAE